MLSEDQDPTEYRCPGADYTISRALHFGRLAGFYPACRTCPHRDDTGALPPGQVRHLQEVAACAPPATCFDDEGLGGVSPHELSATVARRAAAAFGIALAELPSRRDGPASVIVAAGGRSLTASLTASVSEGLRWSGCQVIDIGAASAPCLALTVAATAADGGLLVSNPGQAEHQAGLKFWGPAARPVSRGPLLARIEQLFEEGVDRPARRYGPLRRMAAEAAYLAPLAPSYHALRPLRWIHDSCCVPLAAYLDRLTAVAGCRPIPTPRAQVAAEVAVQQVHFGMHIDGDGEACWLLDERGAAVAPQRLFLLMARQITLSGATVVLEPNTQPGLTRQIEMLGGRAVIGGRYRAEMAECMAEHAAVLGGGGSGRVWYRVDGTPLCDALRTLTLLLVLLSRSDLPLSAVLDRDTPKEYAG